MHRPCTDRNSINMIHDAETAHAESQLSVDTMIRHTAISKPYHLHVCSIKLRNVRCHARNYSLLRSIHRYSFGEMWSLLFAMSILFSTSNGLRVRKTRDMHQLYADAGTGATLEVAIFEPNLGYGEYLVGHSAQRNHDTAPDHEIIVVTPEANDKVTSPADYSMTWNDRNSGGKQDVAFWRPLYPSNYVALGDVITLNYDSPTGSLAQKYACTYLE